MTGTDLAVIQTQIAEAQESGDTARVNELYQTELAVRAGQPAAGRVSSPAAAAPAAFPAEYVEQAFAAMHEADPEGARALQAKWGGDAGKNFSYALAFGYAAGLTDEDLMTLPDDPALYELAAKAGRELVQSTPAPATRTATTTDHGQAAPAVSGDLESFAIGMRQWNARIEQAKNEGNSRLANQLYIQQQAWIGQVKGNGPIVGRGRTA